MNRRLSHTDEAGAARMVDVGAKPATERTAVARGLFCTTADVMQLLRTDGVPKGDALATARVAGIMAAKRTPELVPLCHPIAITSAAVDFEFCERVPALLVFATVRTTGATGVEMEALTAVSVAGLTLHDMVKAVDPAARMTDVLLLRKEGGASGRWEHPDVAAAAEDDSEDADGG